MRCSLLSMVGPIESRYDADRGSQVQRRSRVWHAGSTIDGMHTPTGTYALVEVWNASAVFENVTVSNVAQHVPMPGWQQPASQSAAEAEGQAPMAGKPFTSPESSWPIPAALPTSTGGCLSCSHQAADGPYAADGPWASGGDFTPSVLSYGVFDGYGNRTSIIVLVCLSSTCTPFNKRRFCCFVCASPIRRESVETSWLRKLIHESGKVG